MFDLKSSSYTSSSTPTRCSPSTSETSTTTSKTSTTTSTTISKTSTTTTSTTCKNSNNRAFNLTNPLSTVCILIDNRCHKMFKTASGTTSVASTFVNILPPHLLSIRVQATENWMQFAFFYNKPKLASKQTSERLCCVTPHVSFMHLYSY